MTAPKYPHTVEGLLVAAQLGSGVDGLTAPEAAARLVSYGPNKLPEEQPDRLIFVFLRQFRSPLIYILFAAAAILFLFGDIVDAVLVGVVLLLNAIVGAVQEGRAERTLSALKSFVETNATVVRDGRELIISDTEVVPGDVVILTEGSKVPADARVFSSQSLRVDESSLTGESTPVEKSSDRLSQEGLSVADQRNMVFKGSHVSGGHGRAVVVATGTRTVLGGIAREIALIDTDIPLVTHIRRLSRLIIVAVLSLSLGLFLFGIATGASVADMLGVVVSLAVSVIPEGLPIVVTLILAAGVYRMSKAAVLVKRLAAVEALGAADVIAVDKTGTITKNELVITRFYTRGTMYAVTGAGYEPRGSVLVDEEVVPPADDPGILRIGTVAALCANAHAAYDASAGRWRVFGEPTEAALGVFGEKLGFPKAAVEESHPLVGELPFAFETKYHVTARRAGRTTLLTVVGAPETVFARSTMLWEPSRARRMSAKDREKLEGVYTSMTREGLRVLALATKTLRRDTVEHADIDALTFVGFVGMKDTLRAEVPAVLARAAAADIRIVMITGDHRMTAEAIAREAGIWRDGDRVLTGAEIETLSDEALAQALSRVSVFARVTPEHKFRIVEAYRARGHTIAMTGDGVNDAPSLVAADLGVAMGVLGTEVAKEAADIVLLDDDFGGIVAGIEEGRRIYRTIQKVLLFMFSTSIGEVLVIAGALFIGLPLPILAVQILWLNFVTDGFMNFALAFERDDTNARRTRGSLITRAMAWRMVFMAVPMMLGTLALFSLYYTDDLVKAWTMSLTVLAAFQWFNAWNCSHETRSIFTQNPLRHLPLILATVGVVLLQFAALYIPFLQTILHTAPLSLADWGLVLAVASSIIAAEEIRKFLVRQAGKE